MTDKTELINLPRLVRDLKTERVSVERDAHEAARLAFSASSEAPVNRPWGTEILEHTPRAVRMARIEGGAVPLLFNHDWDDPIGMVDSGRLAGGRLEVSANLFETQRAREVRAMIDGGLRNISIGYEIHALDERRGGEMIATDWEVHEVSVVTVPADPSIGIGRALENEVKPVRVTRAISQPAHTADATEELRMDDQNTAPAGESAEHNVTLTREAKPQNKPIDVAALEKARGETIKKLARSNNVDESIARSWIESGASMDKIADDILSIHEERGKQADAPAMLGMSKREVRQYSIMRAITAAKQNNWKNAGLEFEAHRAMMDRDGLSPRSNSSVYVPMDVTSRQPTYGRRDFTAAVAGAAGGVGTDHLAGSFIDLLYNMSVTMNAGATRLTGLRGNVSIPKLTAGSTAYWLASETTAITESTPTMGALTLTPKNVAALVEVSHQMAQQADPSAEQMVLRDLAQQVSLAMDVGALSGDGTGGAPTGITNTGSIGAFTGTSLDYAAVLNAQEDVIAANADRLSGMAYVADPATVTKLKTRVKFTSTASPIWEGPYRRGTCADEVGMASNQMAADSMLFGAWSSLVIGEWGTLELAVDDKFNFATGSIGLRAWYTVDVGVRYPAAFSLATSIT
jgi:HK97 family phage major capsid protein/HK97 family phage prohead protease